MMDAWNRRKLWMRVGLLAGGIGAAVAMAPAAYANVITGTVSETQSYSSGMSWNTTLAFDGFDALARRNSVPLWNSPYGAKLTKVKLVLTETMSADYTAYNTSTSAGTSGTLTVTHTGTLDLGGTKTVVNSQTTTPAITLGPATSSTSLTGWASTTGTITGSNSISATYTGALSSFLGSYTGASSDNSTSTQSFSGGSGFATVGANTGTLDATITYSYERVPAPGSLAVFGTGLLVLAGIRRFNKKRS